MSDFKRGQYPADLEARVTEVESFTFSRTKARIDLYVSDSNGDDDNSGLSSVSSLKTITEAEKKIPDVIDHPVVVHVGPGSNYRMPTFRYRFYNENIYVIGDGAGQGTDGFNELATDSATGGGNRTVSVSGGLGTDTYKGKTIEILSGNAEGDRRTIRTHTDTSIEVCGGFTNAPSSGDEFRIVEPDITLDFPNQDPTATVSKFVLSKGSNVRIGSISGNSSQPDVANGLFVINFKVDVDDEIFIGDGCVYFFGLEFFGSKNWVKAVGTQNKNSVLITGTERFDETLDKLLEVFHDLGSKSWWSWGIYDTHPIGFHSSSICGRYDSLVVDRFVIFGASLRVKGLDTQNGIRIFGGGDDSPSMLRLTGATHSNGAPNFINSGLPWGIRVQKDSSFATIDNATVDSGSSEGIVADLGGVVEIRGGTSVTSGDGLVARTGGQIYFQNGMSITASSNETLVEDIEATNQTRTLSNYSSSNMYISAGDGSKIQRE